MEGRFDGVQRLFKSSNITKSYLGRCCDEETFQYNYFIRIEFIG
jgi:hypothetical protein